jgi:hypothetical protein
VAGGHAAAAARAAGKTDDLSESATAYCAGGLGMSGDAGGGTCFANTASRSESTTGRYFWSILLSLRLADHEESCCVSEAECRAFIDNPDAVDSFADKYRRRRTMTSR